MSDEIKSLSEQTCIGLIPEYYDGILEATRIAQANDAAIEPFISAILRVFRNSFIQTADADVIALYEEAFGLSASESIVDRRQAVIDYINRDLTINDDVLLEIVRKASGSDEVNTNTNASALTLDVYCDDSAEVTTDQLLAALRAAMNIAPSNLRTTATFKSSFTQTHHYYHAEMARERDFVNNVQALETHTLLVRWGDSIQLPANARLATPVKSKCWWIFGGQIWGNNNHGKGSNYTPVYADGSEAGCVPDDIYKTYNSSTSVGEGYAITSGLCLNTYTGIGTEIQTARINKYYDYIEVYSSPTISQTLNTTLTVFEFDISDFAYPLPFKPTDVYTIRGNELTWNDTGLLSQFLANKPLQLEYYLDEKFTITTLEPPAFEQLP